MNRRTIGVGFIAALLAATIVTPSAAAQDVIEEQFGGAASGRALDIVADGRRLAFGAGMASGELDPVSSGVVANAVGVGTALAEGTMVAAGAPGEHRDGCASPELAGLFSELNLAAGLACGRASVDGATDDLVARGAGSLAHLTVSADDVVSGIVDRLRSDETLGPIVDMAFGELQAIAGEIEAGIDENVDPLVAEGIGTLNEKLGEVTGGLVALPDLDVTDTLGDLLDRIEGQDLATVTLGEAAGQVSSDAARLVSRASDEGASISVLPGFFPGGAALLDITVAASSAEVVYDRATTGRDARTSNQLVRVTSPLLPEEVVVGEGQSVSLLCGDAGNATDEIATLTEGMLCTEIAVGTPDIDENVAGRTQASASTVTIRIAKGLEGVDLPTQELPVLGEVGPGAVIDAVNGVLATLGIDEGVATAAGGSNSGGGVEVVFGGAVAQAGGVKVLGETRIENPDPGRHLGEGTLPRTGGIESLPMAATALLGAGAGLRSLIRRRTGI